MASDKIIATSLYTKLSATQRDVEFPRDLMLLRKVQIIISKPTVPLENYYLIR